MARIEEGKVTLVMDDKDVGTLDWNDPEDQKRMLRLMDQGKWKETNDKDIQGWKKTAEQIEDNKASYDEVMKIAGRLERIKAGTEDPAVLVAELEASGIKLTKKEEKEFEEGELDDVSKKILTEMKALKTELGELKNKSSLSEQTIFNNEEKVAIDNLEKKFDGKNGYPKFSQSDVEAYIKKNGDNSIYHPDIEKQYQLIYKDINEEKILEAERNKGLSPKERQERIKQAQAEKGSSTDIKKDSFSPVHGDKQYDAAAQAMLDDMNATGKSLIIED